MTHVSTGRKRRRRIEELELIHGFPKDYTYQACNAKRRRQFPVEYEDARGALIGNCFSPLVVALFVGELLYAMDGQDPFGTASRRLPRRRAPRR